MSKAKGNTVVEASKAVVDLNTTTPAPAIAAAAPAVPPPLTTEQLLARIAELEKVVTNKNASGTRIKISEKGGVSFYGIGRFPVTLYASQWEILSANMTTIMEFVKANSAQLSHKSENGVQAAA